VTVEDEPEAAPNPRGRGCLIPAVIASTILVLMCGAGGILRYATVFRPVGVTPTATGPTTTPAASTSPAASPSPTPPASVSASMSASASALVSASVSTTTSAKPRVDTLKISQAPTCTSTGPAGTFAGQIQLQWTVSGGPTGSQLFADGALVNTYGKTQTVTLTFACDGSPGATVTHTYTVKTIGGGPQATRSVTGSATIPV
jgi:hypothetical protein